MLPFDQREIPSSIPGGLRRSIEIARALRATPALKLVESLLAMEHSGPQVFTDRVTTNYIRSEFGDDALRLYQQKIPDCATELMEITRQDGFRVSPMATAIRFGEELTAGSPVLASRHGRLASDFLVRAVRGTGRRRLCQAFPFRHGKSLISSVATSLWWLANFPWMTVGLCTCTASLSTTFSRIIRNCIASNPEAFGFRLSDDSASVHQFATEFGGGLWITSLDGSPLGKGCELLLLDDMLASADAAASRVERDKVWQFYGGTATTRIQSEGFCVCTSTRWSADDLHGRLEAGYDSTDSSQYEFLNLPAIAVADEALTGRTKGEALFPEVRSLEELETIKRSVSVSLWSAGYQGIPIESSGVLRVYKEFVPERHVVELVDDEGGRLTVGIDLNVDPWCAVVANVKRGWAPLAHLTNQEIVTIDVLFELVLSDVNTRTAAEALCDLLWKRFRDRGRIKVHLCGDASANARKTSAETVSGAPATDKVILQQVFSERSGRFQSVFEWLSSNPSQSDRANKVNEALRKGQVRVFSGCRELIADLREVRWRTDASGNVLPSIDKRDPKRTHVSDAFGYLINNVFPGSGERYGEMEGSLFI